MRTLLLPALILLVAPLAAQQSVPEGTPVPRFMTDVEKVLWAGGANVARGTGTLPPEGALFCVPEYAPMEAILIAWEGSSSWKTILGRMAGHITTTGNADVYCAVDSSSEISSATSTMTTYGTNMARVHFVVVTTDTIWIRDYGPRYAYQGDVRVVVDHHYNRPRPWDDQYPAVFATQQGHERFHNDVIHGGGNFHLDALGLGYATRLIDNENPSLSEVQLQDRYSDFQNLDLTILDPFPTYIDSTQHLDMWMQIIADDEVVISDWPTQSGTIQDQICDDTAADMTAAGYTVHRIPAVHSSGTHYTFTNVVMCNDLVMIPSYTNSTASAHNATALATWQAALPGKTVVQVPSQSIVTSAGVLHCIMMHYPAFRGAGVEPTVYVKAPVEGSILAPGTGVEVSWVSDDDLNDVVDGDLDWSADGGLTWTSLATNVPAWAQLHSWTVPAGATDSGMLRVTVRDGQGNAGSHFAQVSIATAGDAAWTAFGEGEAGTLGVPSLSLSAAPVSGTAVTLQIDAGKPNSVAKLVRGEERARALFAGTFAWTTPGVLTDIALDGAGHGTLAVNVPASPALLGRSYFLQAWCPGDNIAVGGISASNAIVARIGL